MHTAAGAVEAWNRRGSPTPSDLDAMISARDLEVSRG